MPVRSLSTCFVEPFLKLNEGVLYRIMGEVVTENQPYIKKLNEDRLSRGLNTDGSYIDPPYSPYTVSKKRKKGQQSNYVTLEDEGNFYEGIFTDVFNAAFTVDSTDEKANDLVEKYGDLILGLSKEDKAEFAAYIKPQFIAKIRNYIGL